MWSSTMTYSFLQYVIFMRMKLLLKETAGQMKKERLPYKLVDKDTNCCQCSIFIISAIRCGEPEEIQNGDVDRKCQTFGCRISYQCRAGYELVGRQHRYCQADGSWSPRILPECVRKYRHRHP